MAEQQAKINGSYFTNATKTVESIVSAEHGDLTPDQVNDALALLESLATVAQKASQTVNRATQNAGDANACQSSDELEQLMVAREKLPLAQAVAYKAAYGSLKAWKRQNKAALKVA